MSFCKPNRSEFFTLLTDGRFEGKHMALLELFIKYFLNKPLVLVPLAVHIQMVMDSYLIESFLFGFLVDRGLLSSCSEFEVDA
jgi:hypothetical protein